MPADAKVAASEDAEPAPTPAPAPAAGMRGMIIVLVVTVLLSTAASGGIAWWLSGRNAAPTAAAEEAADEPEEAPAKQGPANYHGLSPAFVVNLEDDEAMRFLQVEVELMTRDADRIDDIKLHAPRIRNSLLMLFGQQSAAAIATREGKEALQAAVLAEVQRILTEETGEPGVEAVYFTSFVMQ